MLGWRAELREDLGEKSRWWIGKHRGPSLTELKHRSTDYTTRESDGLKSATDCVHTSKIHKMMHGQAGRELGLGHEIIQ